jgi:hypothetical protein
MEEARRRRNDNIKMDVKETGCDGVDWIHFTQDEDHRRAFVKTAMNLRVP